MTGPGGGGAAAQYEPHVAAGIVALANAGITVTDDGALAIGAFFFGGQIKDESLADTEFSRVIDKLITLARDRDIQTITGGIFEELKTFFCPWYPFC